MQFDLHCECGVTMKVTQSMCGSQISCGCGRKTMVPRLSELRRNAGLSPSRISPADKLLALSLERELPLESDCMRCGGITQTFLGCLVECEQTYAKRISFSRTSSNVSWFHGSWSHLSKGITTIQKCMVASWC